jgi:hypothetical protein
MVGLFDRLCPICALLLVAGCGRADYDGPKRYPLSGKVTLDGESVDQGFISFLPHTQSERPSGGIVAAGEYLIPEAKGANAGTYTVQVRWSRRTGRRVFDPEIGEMVPEVEDRIPARFNTQSELTVEVSATQTEFDFHLESD